MARDIPTTISSFDERWWEGTLARRRIAHQLPEDEPGDCTYPECVWHGMMPGEENDVSPASPP